MSLTYAIRSSIRLSVLAERRIADYRSDISFALLPEDQIGVEREARYESRLTYLFGQSMAFNFGGAYTKRTSEMFSRRFDGVSLSAGVSHAF